MRVLHTADIHLRESHDERWEALLSLIDIGKENKVDIFAICGDLFDKDIDAETLRPQIREVFSNTSFKVLIIPGNHDSDSYKEGMYFGQDVTILSDQSFENHEARIVGIPFQQIHGEALIAEIRSLKEVFKPDKKNILLCHGELLDAFFSRTDFGAEGEGRYMPFKLSYFDELNVDYVLAGHFHSKFDVWQLKNGGYFVYPGSPVSITRSEVGQRKVNIFEIGEPPQDCAIDTYHFQKVVIDLDPFIDDNPLEIVKRQFEALHPEAKVILLIRGYINSQKTQMSEPDIVTGIQQTTGQKCVEQSYEFRDISHILENDIFKRFMDKAIEICDTDELTNELQDIAIRAMMKADL